MRPGDLAWACAAGIIVGTIAVLSPATVGFMIVMAAVFAWAGRDLGRRERRWVMALLAVAVALRVAMVAGLFLGADHAGQFFVSFPFDGDGRAVKLRATVIRNVWVGIPVDELYVYNAFDRTFAQSSYLLVLSYLQFLIGPTPYGVHLFNIALFVAGSVLLYRTMRRAYGSAVGFGGLAIVLFMPSLFFWSISAMKESLQFFLTSIGLVATASVWHARTWKWRRGALIIAPLAIAALGTVRRDVALAIGLGGTGVGLFVFLITRRFWLFGAAILMLPVAGAAALRQPAVQAQVVEVLRPAAIAHIGNVHTEGHGYKLLDERFYWPDPSGDHRDGNPVLESMTFPEACRYVLRGFASFVVTPAPWQVSSPAELAFVPQQVVWYVLVVLALVGVLPGLRKDALTTCLLGGYTVVGAAVISVASGNIGTFVRHKDIVTPFMIWFSMLGLESVLAGMLAPVRAAPWCQRLQRGMDAACL